MMLRKRMVIAILVLGCLGCSGDSTGDPDFARQSHERMMREQAKTQRKARTDAYNFNKAATARHAARVSAQRNRSNAYKQAQQARIRGR